MRLAIVDYRAGNLTSVQRALAHLGHSASITDDPAAIQAAEQVIFPGVGAAGSCMARLRESGLGEALRARIAADRPTLCICVGLQLLFASSEEDGGTPCLGILPGTVRRFRPSDPAIKVPHMGWNGVRFAAGEPLAAGLPAEAHCYFVHSYYVDPGPGVQVIAEAGHGIRFCAGVRRGRMAAVQFHPEKSGPLGLRLLGNFLSA